MNHWLGQLPVWLVAENGLYIRCGGNDTEWICTLEEVPENTYLKSVRPIFKYFEERTPSSHMEVQEHSITFHFRDCDKDFGEVIPWPCAQPCIAITLPAVMAGDGPRSP